TPAKEIDVEYAGSLDWKITGLVQNDAPFDVSYKELYRRQGEVGYRVTVKLKADAPPGALRQEIFLKTNDRTSEIVPVLVEASVQAALSVTPEKVTWTGLTAGETVEKKVIVRGSQAFQVVGVEGLGDGLEADLPKTKGALQIITFKYKPARS